MLPKINAVAKPVEVVLTGNKLARSNNILSSINARTVETYHCSVIAFYQRFDILQ